MKKSIAFLGAVLFFFGSMWNAQAVDAFVVKILSLTPTSTITANGHTFSYYSSLYGSLNASGNFYNVVAFEPPFAASDASLLAGITGTYFIMYNPSYQQDPAQDISYGQYKFGLKRGPFAYPNEGNYIREILNGSPVEPPEIVGPDEVDLWVNEPASFFLNLSGGAPTSYSATGLPSGLRINSKTGEISGTLVTLGVYSAKITVTNASGSDSRTIVFRIRQRPPEVVSQTGDQLLPLGGKAVFSVTQKYGAKFQWYSYAERYAGASFYPAEVPGATSTTLTLNPTGWNQAGFYYLSIENDVGGVQSDPAELALYQLGSVDWKIQSYPPVYIGSEKFYYLPDAISVDLTFTAEDFVFPEQSHNIGELPANQDYSFGFAIPSTLTPKSTSVVTNQFGTQLYFIGTPSSRPEWKPAGITNAGAFYISKLVFKDYYRDAINHEIIGYLYEFNYAFVSSGAGQVGFLFGIDGAKTAQVAITLLNEPAQPKADGIRLTEGTAFARILLLDFPSLVDSSTPWFLPTGGFPSKSAEATRPFDFAANLNFVKAAPFWQQTDLVGTAELDLPLQTIVQKSRNFDVQGNSAPIPFYEDKLSKTETGTLRLRWGAVVEGDDALTAILGQPPMLQSLDIRVFPAGTVMITTKVSGGTPLEYRVSLSPTFTGAIWQSYVQTISYRPTNPGPIYVQLRNSSGTSQALSVDPNPRPTHSIRLIANPVSKGTVSGMRSYVQGSTASVIARPKRGRKFLGWRENGRIVSRSPTYRFSVWRPRTLTALFK